MAGSGYQSICAPEDFSPYSRPQTGRLARVSRPKLSGWGRHEGVLLPNGLVIHSTSDAGGVEVCPFDVFAQQYDVRIEVEVHPLLYSAALEKINGLVAADAPYDLINNNCETFARAAVLEEPWSPQVVFWGLAAVVAGVWVFDSKAA